MIRRCKLLLAGDEESLARWTREADARWAVACVLISTAGCFLYGATVGLWRSDLQAFYTAVKFPLVVLLTCSGNALLNGILALVLGANLGFRQSVVAILMSFTIMGIILAGFAPLMLFLWWSIPAMGTAHSLIGQNITLLAHVVVIAYAGYMANLRLWQLLRRLTGSSSRAKAVLAAWLAGNLLLGTQITWILRPWIGRPSSPVRFFSPEPLRGNFFEAVWYAVRVLTPL